MKMYIGNKILLAVLVAATLVGCGKKSRTHSELTGWRFNDPTYGGFTANTNYKGQKTPPGMVLIEGGTFTMGAVQDDVMFDWNTTPTKQQIRSFFMDEAEVTNLEYLFYLQYLEKVYPPADDNYRKIYQAALPDTLVWRDALGFNELLTESYLRHPSYSDYPVVGVSWMQASDYCNWRTDRVNERILMEKGVLKSLFNMDSVQVEGKNRFDTGTYLANPKLLFDGDESIYGRGLNDPSVRKPKKKSRKDRKRDKEEAGEDDTVADDGGKKSRRERKRDKKSSQGFTGRHVKMSDGLLAQRFRLPTEAEWEYAAKAEIENREYNTVRGRKKYSWNGRYTRNDSRRGSGEQLANFKQGKGDYSGLAGWSNDGADITIQIKSYDPNAFGLYDMSGNVAEWVADVYRPIIDNDANDFNYFRGNVFKKPLIDEEGKVVVVDYNSIEFDTLDNGKIVPRDLPGSIKYVPITKRDAFMRPNYEKADNRNLNDGDVASTKYYSQGDEEDEDEEGSVKPRMYNSPKTPRQIGESGLIIQQYDTKTRTTLISDEARVYKGGSWRDRAYWLDPAQRRYLPQYMATNNIGFRCATDKLGAMQQKRRRKSPQPRKR